MKYIKRLKSFNEGISLNTSTDDEEKEKEAADFIEIISVQDSVKEAKKFKPGDRWSDDFDYDGMLRFALKVNVNTPIKKLNQLFDSATDVNYHTPFSNLGIAIDWIEDGDKKGAKDYMKQFHSDIKKEMKEQGIKESITEATITFTKPVDLTIFTDEDMEDSEIESYKRGDKESVDILNDNGGVIDVQFDDGSVTSIPKSIIKIKESILNETTAKETLKNAENALTKTIPGRKFNKKYVKDYLDSMERMARKKPGDFVKDYGEFDNEDWLEDVRYNMANESLTIKGKKVKSINKKGNDAEKWTITFIDGTEEPYLQHMNESMIGITTDKSFKPADLQKALDKAKIKGYRMDRLSMTLTALKLDKKYFNDAQKIIDDLGLTVMMAKEGKLNEAWKEKEYYPQTFIDIATAFMKKEYKGRGLGRMPKKKLETIGQKIVDQKYDGDSSKAYKELVGESVIEGYNMKYKDPKVKGKKVAVDTIEIEGVETREGPDDGTTDAFAASAKFTNGKELSANELDDLTDNNPDLIHRLALQQFFESNVNESKVTAKTVDKLTTQLAKVTKQLKDNFAKLQKAKTIGEKEAYYKQAGKLTKEKKAIDAELEAAIQGFGADMELDMNFENVTEGKLHDEVEELVRDLDKNAYSLFADDYDIDPEDANEMMEFIMGLSNKEAKQIIKELKK